MPMRLFVGLFFFLLSSAHAEVNDLKANWPIAIIYDGVGTCDGCAYDMGKALSQIQYRVKLIHPQTEPKDRITEEFLKRGDLFIIPGGDDEVVLKKALKAEEFTAIQNYVRNGGVFLGSCMGAYFASTILWGEGNPKEPGLGLFQGMVKAHRPTKEPRVENIVWKGIHRWMYFQDGPEMIPASVAVETETIDVWGRYEDGKIAAVQAAYGRGRVGLLGPHPEANPGWFAEDHISDPDGSDMDQFRDFMKYLMKDHVRVQPNQF